MTLSQPERVQWRRYVEAALHGAYAGDAAITRNTVQPSQMADTIAYQADQLIQAERDRAAPGAVRVTMQDGGP